MARQPEVRYINHYVSGSLAYEPEMKPRRKPKVQLPKVKRQKKMMIPFDPMAVCGIAVALVLMITMLGSVIHWGQAHREATALKEYVAQLQEENSKLRHTYESGFDPEEIREIALNMGMIPVEQAQHIQMQVVIPQVVEEPTGWSAVWAFILGMFA